MCRDRCAPMCSLLPWLSTLRFLGPIRALPTPQLYPEHPCDSGEGQNPDPKELIDENKCSRTSQYVGMGGHNMWVDSLCVRRHRCKSDHLYSFEVDMQDCPAYMSECPCAPLLRRLWNMWGSLAPTYTWGEPSGCWQSRQKAGHESSLLLEEAAASPTYHFSLEFRSKHNASACCSLLGVSLSCLSPAYPFLTPRPGH